MFFRVTDDDTGNELWKSDGTASGTVMVKDIRPGASGSFPDRLTDVAGTLFFRADDGTNGNELWKSDGTASGTVMVKDIRPFSSSFPDDLVAVNGELFFEANAGTNGSELWKSDGTATGTVLVKDIYPGFSSPSFSLPMPVNGTLFFRASNGTNGHELWKSDGTATGTVMVKDIDPGSSSGFPDWLTNVSGTLFFTADDPVFGRELWKSDGTATGTVQVKDVYPGGLSASPVELTAADGRLFFRASDGVHGHELWWSDGTSNGTIMIADIRPGSSSSLLENVLAIPDLGLGITRIFFRANDGSKGNELWSAILNPNPVADLAVTKQDSPDPVFADEPLTYTIGVTNNGPGAATGVTLVDTLPPTITFGSVTTTQGTCSESGGTVTCDLGVMPVGAQATATIDIFTPTATGTIFNFAEVESNEIDPVPANNTTTEATDVVDPPPISDLSISKTVLHELVAVGVPIHYTLTLRNEGPAVATDVSVTDVLPAGTVATSATTPQGTCTIGTGTVTCDLGSVAKRVDLTPNPPKG